MLNGRLRYVQFDDMLRIIENWFDSDSDTLMIYHHALNRKLTDRYVVDLDYARTNRLVAVGVLATPPPNLGSRITAPEVEDFKLTVYGWILIQLLNTHDSTPLEDFSEHSYLVGQRINHYGLGDV